MLNWLTSRSPHGDLQEERNREGAECDQSHPAEVVEAPEASSENPGVAEQPSVDVPGGAEAAVTSPVFVTPKTVLFTQGVDTRDCSRDDQEDSASPSLRRSTRVVRKRKGTEEPPRLRSPQGKRG